MTILGTAQQACISGSQLQLGGYMICSHATRDVMHYASTSWAQFCFLQVCFIVIGLEDPWLHRGKGKGLASRIGEVPLDVLLFARAVPLTVLLCGFGRADESRLDDPPDPTWTQQVTMVSRLLLFGSVAWWLGSQTRRVQGLDILFRVRFWTRIGALLLLPFLVLFPITLAGGAPGWRVLQAARHAGFSAIACGVCSDVFRGKVDLSDRSSQNWLIIPWVPLATGLMFFATGFGALYIDNAACTINHLQCNREKQWPTLLAVSGLPGGRFILFVMGPFVLLSAAATMWIIDSCPLERSPLQMESIFQQFHVSFEHRFTWLVHVLTRKRREKCRWLGCRCLIVSICLGGMTLLLEGGSLLNVLHLAITLLFLLSLLLGISLCTASSISATSFGFLRLLATCAIIADLLALLLLSVLTYPDTNVPDHDVSHTTLRAVFDNTAVLFAAIWLMTWMEDAQAVRDPWSVSVSDASNL
eukprot:CAMPEP_0169126804 /NCGR_PEP_ID=MMETSP1015-20121227/35652_1 /TAXON_ID=342587 /ORGANISM="Karlodinium micrum, Strain CCMP2283" /LENGTH=471 /DNA_ID=CAMNT_0009190509 /DNA_START=281 /DNA_END=1696 /DNA_ORIENTATION=-